MANLSDLNKQMSRRKPAKKFVSKYVPRGSADFIIKKESSLAGKAVVLKPVAAQRNRERSVNQVSTKCEPNVNEASTKREPNVNKNAAERLTREQSVNQVSTKCEPNVNEASIKFDHDLLSKFQIQIGLYLINNYVSNSQKRTGRVSTPLMVESLKTTCGSVRSSILQMKKNGCFKSVKAKKYHREFILSDSFFYFMGTLRKTQSVNETSTNRERNVNQPLAHPSIAVSSSNSSINNTITTKKDENWLKNIQTPENLKNLGLGVNHIKQLKDKFSLSIEEIQQGLEAFSYDLANGELERLKKRGIQNIIGYFFGAMKNGGYNSVKEDFITAEDLAENEMLQRLEKIKNERFERKEKLEELLFSEWLETKSKEDLLKIESPLVNYMDSFHKSALKGYFLENEMVKFQKELR